MSREPVDQATTSAADDGDAGGAAADPVGEEIRAEVEANREANREAKKDHTVPDWMPAADAKLRQCRWLSTAFPLHPSHPIVGGRRGGSNGATGHVQLDRKDVAPIRFEPASVINTPAKLITALSWELLPIDGPVPAFKGEHCRLISHVMRMLCTYDRTVTAEQETAGIVDSFLQTAEPLSEYTTYGTSQERFAAAAALRHDGVERYGRHTYLIDRSTGELVINVSDLQAAARSTTGTSHAHGWLDGRMETSLHWTRIRLEGYEHPGRRGRQEGRHLRVYAYRGVLPAGPVNT